MANPVECGPAGKSKTGHLPSSNVFKYVVKGNLIKVERALRTIYIHMMSSH